MCRRAALEAGLVGEIRDGIGKGITGRLFTNTRKVEVGKTPSGQLIVVIEDRLKR